MTRGESHISSNPWAVPVGWCPRYQTGGHDLRVVAEVGREWGERPWALQRILFSTVERENARPTDWRGSGALLTLCSESELPRGLSCTLFGSCNQRTFGPSQAAASA